MMVCDHRTQPLPMMAIQITHKQEAQHLQQPLMLVNNKKSSHLGQGSGKYLTH